MNSKIKNDSKTNHFDKEKEVYKGIPKIIYSEIQGWKWKNSIFPGKPEEGC